MEFKYLEEDDICHPLITDFYQLKIEKEDLPFESVIVPVGETSITYVYCKKPQLSIKKKETIKYKDLTVTGQFYGSYKILVKSKSENLGFSLHPTSLYKILKTDISKLNNKHLPLQEVDADFFKKLNEIFTDYRNDLMEWKKQICILLDEIELANDSFLPTIDDIIAYIIENDGLVKVTDILDEFHISQKHLENNFKKIIGVTPGKYIRQHRFVKLIKKYQSNEIDLKELIHNFDYFDASHFIRDCNFFLGQSPKVFFKNDLPLIEKYLVE